MWQFSFTLYLGIQSNDSDFYTNHASILQPSFVPSFLRYLDRQEFTVEDW